MIIFKQNFLLKKINKNCFTKNLRPQNHRKEAERLWQFHSLKLASLNLLSNLQYKPSLIYQKSTTNTLPNFLSFFGIFIRGGDVFSI